MARLLKRDRRLSGLTTLSMLNTTSHIPLYIQVAQNLRQSIDNGTYRPGAKLPSEKELMERFGISRITATAALEALVKERLAYRERGRGTFVAKPLISDFSLFSSFTEDMLERGFRPSSRLISLQPSHPDESTLEKLKMPPDGEYTCLTRVRLANDVPVAFQKAYLPVELYPGLTLGDFEQRHLYEVIRKKYGYSLVWAEAIVEAGAASVEEAGYLELKAGSPVLDIWHLTLDERYLPLEYVRSVYRSDRFSFSTGRNPIRSFSS